MKKIFTLFTVFILSMVYATFAQTPLTLTQSNFGKIGTYNQNYTSNLSTITFGSTNYVLNYDTATLLSNGALAYPTATDAFFTPHCDAYYEGTTTAKNFFYYTNFYFSTNANEYGENAIHIPAQGYSETAVTGGVNDSIIFPDQKYILNQARTVVKFPATIGYYNKSVSKREAQFNITVAAYMLNHTPAWHVNYIHREDTILGWGKMRIYTATGPSIYYDVLSMLSVQYQIDSFFLGSRYSVAPAALTNAFGVSQGQHVNDRNRIYYLRANRAQPLMLAILDSALTTFNGLYFDGDNITTATGVENVTDAKYSTLLFPNPANQNQINLQFIGKTISSANYTITDISGKVIAANTASLNNNVLQVNFDNSVINGMYFINVTDDKNNSIAAEQFSVQR
ncbi:MAG: hypothetical protein RIQ33_1271 [Bacteroidota bacterium]|jgi:hypothetical protein